jgi:hypothetical protein
MPAAVVARLRKADGRASSGQSTLAAAHSARKASIDSGGRHDGPAEHQPEGRSPRPANNLPFAGP